MRTHADRIYSAIDFIWGYSKAYFKGCTIGAKRKSSAITAHSRASSSAIGGYIFDNCLFTTAPGVADDLTNKVYLGRPYSAYASVVVKNSYIDSAIAPAGWKIWSATDPRTDHITFAEFNNSGPSNWENNAAARQAFGFATLLTSDTYSLSSAMDSTEWIDMTYWNSIITPAPAVAVPAVPTNITVGGNSTVDGTTPPSGALIVSKSSIAGITTYQTIQDALNAAPITSKTNATIFIYPGVYNEQLIVNKSGTTIFMGYSNATDDYSQNQVSIEFNHGIDTQGTDGSDTDGATVYATGNYFYAYNINFRNTAGTTQNIASLGFAVKSSKFAALYGCQIYGNQDTLDISGNLFTFKTYIEGNVDFIFGNGAAYFLDSTISPNEDGISITADKRTTNTTAGGLVFDQCTIKPAPGTGPFKNVGLGRPWNSNARVAFVDCYLDSMISAAGWNQWSKSSPQTDGVVFAEYHNYGPGSNACNRASFSQLLSDADVVQFQLGNFFASTKFIDFSRVDTQPFTVGIGSAQTCVTASSSASLVSSTASLTASLVSSTASSSVTPSSSIVSSSLSASSLPVVTVYTTTTAIVKLTASTTITQADATSTIVLKVTSTASITGADVVKTDIEKETATISYTSPDVTSTSTQVVTEDDGLTVTPDPVTKNSVVKATTTVGGTTTAKAPTTTIKGTTTSTLTSTMSPKPTTLTQSEGSTTTLTSSITPKGASTTIKTTISVEPSSTKTTTIKAKSSVTISTVSLKTVTKKTTTTESCIPTEPARMVRRGAVLPRAAGSTTTVTISTAITSFVKTATATQAGSTALVTETSVAKIKTFTQPGATSTVSLTSFVKTTTIAQAGNTQFVTVTSTEKIGKTTTLKAATTTVLSTSYITQQQLQTVTPEAVTISSLQTRTSTQIVTADQQTVYITKSADVTSTVRTTLPVSTSTVFQTVTQGGGVATITVTAPPGTKTVIAKSTTTVLSVATKYAKDAQACE